MPIGSSKIGVLGAGLVPGGTETFNAPGTFSIPPGVKKVSITGTGGTGNPGNPGNPGNAGNPGSGAPGGKGGAGVTIAGNLGNVPGAGAAYKLGSTQFAPYSNLAVGPIGPPSYPWLLETPGNDRFQACSGQAGTAGNAGTTGNPGNTGGTTSGLCFNFTGGAGGNSGQAGNAGNGGTGGTVGSLGTPGAQGGGGGAGGNGGGSGGSGLSGPKTVSQYGGFVNGLTVNNYTPFGCPVTVQGYGGLGGGGAGAINSGSTGSSGFLTSCGITSPGPAAPITTNTAVKQKLGTGGTDNTISGSAGNFGSPSCVVGIPQSANMMGGIGGHGVTNPGIFQFYGSGGDAIGQNSQTKGPVYCGNIINQGTPVPILGNLLSLPGRIGLPTGQAFTSFNPSLPQSTNVYRAGGGGGAGGLSSRPSTGGGVFNNTFNIQTGGGGGGGGRGNAGNAGGTQVTGGSGVVATPVTHNCVPVTPGGTAPITVGTPGGQVVISWNPQ